MPQPLRRFALLPVLLLALAWLAAPAQAAGIADFVGHYEGKAAFEEQGEARTRDLSVDIVETRDGFRVDWTTVTYKPDGRVKEASYSIEFVPSDRENVFAAAMRRNVFGHAVQLDPMKGEPYVWARITGDTLTVYSLFVVADGGYELQQFDRTLTEGGLALEFQRIRNGAIRRTISAFLRRVG